MTNEVIYTNDNRPIVKIYDLATGDEIERQMNDQEWAQFQIDRAESQARNEALAEALAKRTAALAKLEALGLDEDDLKALGL